MDTSGLEHNGAVQEEGRVHNLARFAGGTVLVLAAAGATLLALMHGLPHPDINVSPIPDAGEHLNGMIEGATRVVGYLGHIARGEL